MTPAAGKISTDRHERIDAVQNTIGQTTLYARACFKLHVTQTLHLHFRRSPRARGGLGAGLACILVNVKGRLEEVIGIVEGLQA
jgi:hypothetical protein